MDDSYRIAVAGIGAVAELHAMAIDELDAATLVAGSCRTPDKGEEFAEEFDADWWGETETMLDEARPDVLIVCTPSGAHLEPTLAAIDREIHVLCEKPLEITTERIDRMIDAASRADVSLGGVFQQRFNDVLTEVASAATAGRFGRLAVANAYVPWWRADEYYDGAWQGTQELDGGGALMNQSIHAVDAIQWLAGRAIGADGDTNPVAEVTAYTGRRCHDEELMNVEDTAVAALRYQNGSLGQILGSTAMYPGSRRRLQLGGRDGTAEVMEDELVTWSFRDERTSDADIREEFGDAGTTGGAADPMAIDYELHRRNIEAFLKSLRGQAPNPVPAHEARKAVAIIESIYESAAEGHPVDVA